MVTVPLEDTLLLASLALAVPTLCQSFLVSPPMYSLQLTPKPSELFPV